MGKSYYYVNPKYAFKGTEKDRFFLIKEIVQDRIMAKKGIDMIANEPLDENYFADWKGKGK